MRPVAIIAILLLLPFTLADARPLNHWDECRNEGVSPTARDNCIRLDLHTREEPVEEALESTGKHWFLWLGTPEAKLTESENVFTGQQGLVPLLYGDTNGLEGLQRTGGNYGGYRAADSLVLA